jgi:adenylyl-sulfate kinase
MSNFKATTIWFTGLSASGKSTLSERLFKELKQLGLKNVELLDGEAVRDILKNDNFDESNREKIGIQKAKIALELNKQGKIVLVSGIAHKKKWRDDIRVMFDNYYEIYLDCSLEDCSKRDYKGNYQKALSGELDNFIGISEPYEVSDSFDLVVDSGRCSIEDCSQTILTSVLNFINKK